VNRPLWLIAKQEFTLNRRNRWVMSFAVVFSALTILVSLLGMVTSGYSGFQDFVRTSASIINLNGFLVPLFALLLGVFSFLSYREHLELIVTQPVSRRRVIAGKYLGLLLTVVAATLLGLGLPGIVFSLVLGIQGALQYAIVVLLALLLAVVFTGLAVVIALLSRRQQIALGIAVAVWIFFELVYGMLMLGTTLHFSQATLKVLLLAGLMANPVDLTRVLALLVVGGPHFFGPAGATLVKLTGSAPIASLIGLAALVLWILIPLIVSVRVFSRQNL
jgi:Cu-processing system permease protein